MRKGDYAGAEKQYQKASSADPKNASYALAYGKAAWKAKDLDTASTGLRKASQLGATEANKYLGYVLSELGDDSGASAAWTSYLKTTKDPEVEAKLKAIGG